MTALIVLASLWDIYDRKVGDLARAEKIETLIGDVRAIAAVHNKNAVLELKLRMPENSLLRATYVDLAAIGRHLENDVPLRGDGYPHGLLRLLGPNPEEEKAYKIKHLLWKLRLKGLHSIKMTLRNSGEISADRIDLFLYVPENLRPCVNVPAEPTQTRGEAIALHNLQVPRPNRPTLRAKSSGNVQLHWKIDSLNPGIHRVLTFLIEPGDTEGNFLLRYSISTKSSGKFSGDLVLTVKRLAAIDRPI